MKRLLAVPAILLILIAFAFFALPYLVPGTFLHSQLAPILKEQAGINLRKVERIRLAFDPEFGVAVENVEADIGKGDRAARGLKASRILVSIDMGALLGGALAFEKIRLERPVITIQNRFMGLAHTDYPASKLPIVKAALAQAQTLRAPMRMPATDIDIVDGTINILNRLGKAVLIIEDTNIAVRNGADRNDITLDGGFSLGSEPFRMKAIAAPSDKALLSYALNADLRSPAIATALEGNIRLEDQPNFDGIIETNIVSAENFARWLDSDAAVIGRLNDARFEGRVNITGKAFILTGGQLTAPSVKSDLSITVEYGKHFEASFTNGKIYGGESEGSFTLSRGKDASRLRASLDVAGVDSLALGRDLPGFDWLSGPIDTTFDIESSGRNWQEMIERLKGQSAFKVTDGAVQGIDLPLIVARAKEGKFDAWERKSGLMTPFNIIEANYTIKNGVGRTTDLRMEGPDVFVTGKGRVDFARKHIAYKLQSRISAPGDADENEENDERVQFSMPLIVKGNWVKPQIYPDFAKMLKDPDSVSGTSDLIGKSLKTLTEGDRDVNGVTELINGLLGNKKGKVSEGDKEQ